MVIYRETQVTGFISMSNPITLVFHSTEAQVSEKFEKDFRISYRLLNPLTFSEPHYARLIWFGGNTRSVFVLADFVEKSQFNFKY